MPFGSPVLAACGSRPAARRRPACAAPRGYMNALDDAVEIMDRIATPVDVKEDTQLLKVVSSCLNTKFVGRYGADAG
eukprot:gene17235-10585_t